MYNVYTSYFSGIRKYNLNLNDCISIARYPPNGVIMNEYQKLFPTYEILKDYKSGKIDEKEYKYRYINEVLSKLNPIEIAKELNGKILICYESPNNFCHRKIISEWLNNVESINSEEWSK